MRYRSIVLCLALSISLLGACKKHQVEQNNDVSDAQQVQGTQQQVQQQEAAPQQDQSEQQVQRPLAPVIKGPASYAQPLRPETVIVTRKFTCKNDTKFTARFMHNPGQVEITFPGRVPVTLAEQYTGSGFNYQTSQYQLIGSGTQAQWVMNGKSPVNCNVAH
jgi:hypothetical protein